jgi:hypothetical protein
MKLALRSLVVCVALVFAAARVDASPINLTHTEEFTSPLDLYGGIVGVNWVFYPGTSPEPTLLLDFGHLEPGQSASLGPGDTNFATVAAWMSGGNWYGQFGNGFTPGGHAGDYGWLGGSNGLLFSEATNLLVQPTLFTLTINGYTVLDTPHPMCNCIPDYFVNYTFTMTGENLGENPIANPFPAPVPDGTNTLVLALCGAVSLLVISRYVESTPQS